MEKGSWPEKGSVMANFRKKPVVIEARQLINNNDDRAEGGLDELTKWVNFNGGRATHNGTNILINTLEGVMTVGYRDWIIRGVKGEFYPCKPDIFEFTYEPVDDPIEHVWRRPQLGEPREEGGVCVKCGRYANAEGTQRCTPWGEEGPQ